MSLYRYISAKDDLVALLDDALIGESLVPDGELPADWRAALAAIARQARVAYLRHPWAVASLQGRAAGGRGGSLGPNAMRHFEQSLAALDGAPLDTAARLDLLVIVDDYVFGSVLRAGELQAGPAAASPERTAAIMEFARGMLATGQFPRTAALVGDPAAAALADPGAQDARFERGLAMLLDRALATAASPADASPSG